MLFTRFFMKIYSRHFHYSYVVANAKIHIQYNFRKNRICSFLEKKIIFHEICLLERNFEKKWKDSDIGLLLFELGTKKQTKNNFKAWCKTSSNIDSNSLISIPIRIHFEIFSSETEINKKIKSEDPKIRILTLHPSFGSFKNKLQILKIINSTKNEFEYGCIRWSFSYILRAFFLHIWVTCSAVAWGCP